MRRIIILAAISVLATARPELYKEKEDFKYSRSSTDEGSKSGFYGAQRGNMGGNFERAHNMDGLAQHQMSGLVSQVEGELGDGANTRSGSVYSAANSRGIYGSGHYDVNNLKGRNFQESEFNGGSHSKSSSSLYNNAAYTNNLALSSGYRGHHGSGRSGESWQSSDLQSLDQGAGLYDYGHQTSSGHHSQTGYRSHSTFGTSDANSHSGEYGSNVQTRLVSAVPVRIVVRPGTRVAIPIGAQTTLNQDSSTYDTNQRSSAYDLSHRSSSYAANDRSSSYDQSLRNSEAEVLSDNGHHNAYTPTNNAKHYESSYSYRKEWEKHNTIPATIQTPTENPFPQNSENGDLYEDRQAHTSNLLSSDSERAHSSNAYSGYRANVKSSQFRHQSDLNSQQYGSLSASNLKEHTQTTGHNTDFNTDLNSQVEDINTKPKSYHSSYAYHKSWERQGDPYVIEPASSGASQSSQRYSAGTKSGSYRSGSQHQNQIDCDELCGHVRVARSYDPSQYQEDLGQQSQNLEDFGQQQSQNLEDFGQQQSQNLEDFGQQQSQNLEYFGQQQSQNLDDFGQQQSKKLEDFGQQTQGKWENLEDLKHVAYNRDQQAEDLGQQTQHVGQNAQITRDKLPSNTEQQIQNNWWSLSKVKDEDEQQHQDNMNIQIPIENKSNQQVHTELNSDEFSRTFKNNDDDSQKYPFKAQFQSEEQSNMKDKHFYTGVNHEQSSFGNSFMHENSYLNHKNIQTTNEQRKLESDTTGHFENNMHELTTHNDSYLHNTPKNLQDNTTLFNFWNKLDNIENQLQTSSNKSSNNKYNSSSGYQQNDLVLQFEHHSLPNNENNITHVKRHEDHDKKAPQNTGRGDIATEDIYTEIDGEISEEKLYPSESSNLMIPVVVGSLNSTQQINNKSTDSQRSDNHKFMLSTSISTYENFEKYGHHTSLHHTEDTSGTRGESNIINQHNVDSLGQKMEGTEYDKELGLHSLNQNKYQLNLEDLSTITSENIHNPKLDSSAKSNTWDRQNEQQLGRNENMENQNVHNFAQETENLEKIHVNDFRQQNENFEQQNSQDFKYMNLHNFGQHENTDLQNQHNFEQTQDLEQQNLQDFGQQHENISLQNQHNFEQTQDLEQQNSQDFDQQNLMNFGQQNENFDQQNVQDFEQQNLQNFGQQEDLSQQNLQNFGQQEDLSQQNLQNFGQQEELSQQNLQNFTQYTEDLQEQNIQVFGQQNDNLEQQNIQDFEHQLWNYENQNLPKFRYSEQHNTHNYEQQNQDKFENLNYGPQQQRIGQSRDNFKEQNLPDDSDIKKQRSHNSEHNLERFVPVDSVDKGTKSQPEKMEVLQLDTQSNSNLQSTLPKISNIELQQEPVTEKPGFWKSIGNKIGSAKTKVWSWFGS